MKPKRVGSMPDKKELQKAFVIELTNNAKSFDEKVTAARMIVKKNKKRVTNFIKTSLKKQ
tara:strand:- start:276 stop:455 length:180 start_codon:yes stop_codon:yes gene_type:complete